MPSAACGKKYLDQVHKRAPSISKPESHGTAGTIDSTSSTHDPLLLLSIFIFNCWVGEFLNRLQEVRNLVKRESEDKGRVMGERGEEIRGMRETLSGGVCGDGDGIREGCSRRRTRSRLGNGVRENQSRKTEVLCILSAGC